MVIHTHFAYAAGTTTPGATLAFLPTSDSELRPYDGNQTGDLLALMGSNSAPGPAVVIDFDVPQLPAFQEQKIIPLADNNDNTLAGALGRNIFPLQGFSLQNGYTLEPKGISGGSDMFGFGLMVRYGKPLPAQNGRIIRRQGTITLTSADVWTAGTAISDLDPNRAYGVRGMQALPNAAKQTIGVRLVMAESGGRPGVVIGEEVDFVKEFGEYAAIITGRSNPYLEGLSAEASGSVSYVLVLEELGGATSPGETSTGALQGLAGAGSFFNPGVGGVVQNLGNFFGTGRKMY